MATPKRKNPALTGPKYPKGRAIALIVEELTRNPKARLEDIAEYLGITRQAVYAGLRRHRPDLLAVPHTLEDSASYWPNGKPGAQ